VILRAPARLCPQRFRDGGVAVADRHAQVAEIEVQVAVRVDVGEGGTRAIRDVDRRCAVQPGHPGHRYAERQMRRRTTLQFAGAWRTAQELRVLAAAQGRQARAVNHG